MLLNFKSTAERENGHTQLYHCVRFSSEEWRECLFMSAKFQTARDIFLLEKSFYCKFADGAVVKRLHFHCWGPGFDPWLGN